MSLLLFASAGLAGVARASADADAPPPSISSEKPDYSPGEAVTLAGSNWAPGESVHIVVNDNAGQTWRRDVDVVADADGHVVDQFNLPDWFVAVYSVTATGAQSGTATTTFTDGNVTLRLPATEGVTSMTVAFGRFDGTNASPNNNCSGTPTLSGTITVTSGGTANIPGFGGSTDSVRLGSVTTPTTTRTFDKWTSGSKTTDSGTTLPGSPTPCISNGSGGTNGNVTDAYAHFKDANHAPTASAGGPYAGNEGAAISLNGSGSSDPDAGDTLTYAWSFTKGAGVRAAATCSFSSATAQNPTFICTDNGSYTVSLTVTDDHSVPSAASTAAVSVANVAPTATFNTPSSVDEGSSINVSLTAASDASSVDAAAAFTYAFDCGSGYGAFGVANSASCSTTDNGIRTVKGKVKDQDGGETEYTASVTVNNVAPTGTLGNDGPKNEGSAVMVSFGGVSDPSSVDAASLHYAFDCAGGSLTSVTYASAGTSSSTSCTFDDDGSDSVSGVIIDKDGGRHDATTSVAIANVAPSVTLSGPVSAGEGGLVAFSYSWSDPGSGDTFPAGDNSVDCGPGGTASDEVFTPAAKTGSFKCTFTDDSGAGTFAVKATVTDDDGGVGSGTKQIGVANVAPTATFGDDGPVDEGSSFHLSLTDGDDVSSADKATGFTYAFDCGDGSGYSSFGPSSTATCPTNDNGIRSVKGQIRDKDDGVSEYTGSVTVRNVAPSVSLSGDGQVDEGTTKTYSFTVSDPGRDTFAVSDGYPTCGAHGQLVPGSLETEDDGGNFRCSFADGPADTNVAVIVVDDDGAASNEASQAVHVANVPPSAFLAAANELMVDEGSTHTYSYSIVDPGDDAVTSVQTSCGANGVKVGSESNTESGGSFQCRFPDGPADSNVSASATDSDGDTGAADTQSVHVANVAPSVSLSGDAEVDEGTTHTYSFTVSDPGADGFAVSDGYPSCGVGGQVVAGSLDIDGEGGGFRCSFPDGPAMTAVAIKVADSDGASDADSEAVRVVEVANVAPALVAADDQSADEGELKSFSLGSFTDPGSDSPWSVDVNWGDGSAHTAFSETTPGALAAESHRYDDNGAYTVTVSVADKDGAGDSKTFQVEVANVVPTATFGDDGPVDEGSSFHLGLTDGDDVSSADKATGFQYRFDCGDGSGYSAFGPSSTATCPTHDNGIRSVKGQIRDKDGGVSEYSASVTINNIAPVVTAAADQATDEGTSASLELGSFTDPGADSPWQVHVNWGDGSPQTTFSMGAATVLPGKSHAYADNGSYTVTLTVTDKDGASDGKTFQVSVANIAPAVSAAADHTADEGASRDFGLGSFTDPGTDAPWHVDVDWGDGSAHYAAIAMSAGSLGLAPHAYGDNGAYTVTVKVTDKDGGSDTKAYKVTVENVAPTATFHNDGPVDEGSSFTLSLADPRDVAADEAAGFAYSFDCGDGTGYGAESTSASATCPTSDSGTRSVRGKIRDKDGGAQEYGASVTIRNIAPTVTAPANQTGSEGSSTSFDLGSFFDPGADSPWAVDVNWGDGSAHTMFGATSKGTLGSKSHTYADNGTYTVTVKVTDKDGGSESKSFTAAISNVAPKITSFTGTDYLYGPNSFVNNVSPTSTFTTFFTDPGADTWSALFTWPDGTPLSQTVSPFASGQPVLHAFASAGCKTASVKVADDEGDFDTASTAVKVGTGQFLPPMTNQPVTDKLKNGQVVPVKIKITDCNGLPATNLAPAIRLLKGDLTPLLDDATAPISIPTSSSAADTTGIMRSNGDGTYIYNMQVNITLNTDYTVLIYPYGTANPQKLGHVIQATK